MSGFDPVFPFFGLGLDIVLVDRNGFSKCLDGFLSDGALPPVIRMVEARNSHEARFSAQRVREFRLGVVREEGLEGSRVAYYVENP